MLSFYKDLSSLLLTEDVETPEKIDSVIKFATIYCGMTEKTAAYASFFMSDDIVAMTPFMLLALGDYATKKVYDLLPEYKQEQYSFLDANIIMSPDMFRDILSKIETEAAVDMLGCFDQLTSARIMRNTIQDIKSKHINYYKSENVRQSNKINWMQNIINEQKEEISQQKAEIARLSAVVSKQTEEIAEQDEIFQEKLNEVSSDSYSKGFSFGYEIGIGEENEAEKAGYERCLKDMRKKKPAKRKR